MNHDNMIRLKEWLLAGAPHAVFTMHWGLGRVTEVEQTYDWDNVTAEEKAKILADPDCGTVCCIAGAASWMAQGMPKDAPDEFWDFTARRAIEWLDLPHADKQQDHDYHEHPLFDPQLAPYGCTPLEAAQAVQNVIDGKLNCWKGVRP